jgi:hypothetical protein
VRRTTTMTMGLCLPWVSPGLEARTQERRSLTWRIGTGAGVDLEAKGKVRPQMDESVPPDMQLMFVAVELVNTEVWFFAEAGKMAVFGS